MVEVTLKAMSLFSRLPDTALAEVSSALQPRRLSAGEILFNLGDPGDELIIVEQGSIAIYVPMVGAPEEGQPIRIFHAGELLGEMAPIDSKPRSASARAEEPTLVLALNGEKFRSILSQNPEMAFSVMAGLSDRIRYTTDFLGEVRQWIRRIADGHYQESPGLESAEYHDRTLAELAAEFARMAALVREREETLRREVAQLRIEIDQVKRQQEAEQIMASDYYKSLKEKAESLRKRDE